MPHAKRTYKDHNGGYWDYVNDDELQGMYPTGGFRIFSDMHTHGNGKTDDYIIGEQTERRLNPYLQKLSWSKRIAGYIPVTDEKGEEGFIRIIGNPWHRQFLPVLAVFICAFLFLGGVWFAQKDEVPGLDKTAVSYHIDGVKNKDEDSILLPGISVINVKENDSHVEASLFNPEGNVCYFKYTMILKDTEEVLYTSGLIEPGKAVTEFDLDKKFKAGTYPVELIVETSDLKDPEVVYNGGNIDAQLNVTK